MKLEKLFYSQHAGEPNEWKIDPLEFGEITLLVGRNASGKTKTLNIIKNLAHLLGGEMQPAYKSGSFHAFFFDHDGKKLEYVLSYKGEKIIKEIFDVDGKRLLERGEGGIGNLWAAQENKNIQFQTPETQLACVARRDALQHPFLQQLFEWGKSVNHYSFGSDLGKSSFGILLKDIPEINPKDPTHLLRIFRKGCCKDTFLDAVKKSMAQLGYEIEDIGLQAQGSVTFAVEGQSQSLFGLYVKEKQLNVNTDQNEMSQGMFRALAIIIHITYAELASIPSCILIDDIGEGLDFERSCSLIELLVQKAKDTHVQLIMSTNDRFIMNKVPLKAWTLLQRDGTNIHVFNYANSKNLFDEFAVTGLNNFDFFSMGFVNQAKSGK